MATLPIHSRPAALKDAAALDECPYVQVSVPLEPAAYRRDDYFCLFMPRIHPDAALADKGSWQCQVDFLAANGLAETKRNRAHHSYAVGCINEQVGNFTALCACEAIPDRLELITYMVEYAYIHDDVIEYAENKGSSELAETNRSHFEGLTGEARTTTKENVRRRHLQAKMATRLLEIDAKKGKENLQLWKEMSETFVEIRDLHWTNLDDYLAFRVIDAGCPWTMSLLCFASDFALTPDEEQETKALTTAAFGAWCLVNDYFSFAKEWQNHLANDKQGEIVSSVFLYMKWHGVGVDEARSLLRAEIVRRERRIIELEAAIAARGALTPHIAQWFGILETVTAGNFAWSMTTARYHASVEDPYAALRLGHQDAREQYGAGTETNTAVAFPSGQSQCDDVLPRSSHSSELSDASSDASCDASTHKTSLSSGSHDLDDSPARLPSAKHVEEPSIEPQYSEMSGPSLESFNDTVLEPGTYVESLPSKGVRNSVLDALEVWYQVPDRSLISIREMIDLLHSASLMLDDIQDSSELRRGFPATHTVFGVDRTSNAANFMMIKAVRIAQSLSVAAATLVLDKLVEGHLGQGIDIYWTNHAVIPTVPEYFSMVDGKTGALFVLLADLMRSEATVNKDLDLTRASKLIGRFFQARDDFQNLTAAEYTSQKGFAEDISEGKLSLPVIHALHSPVIGGRLASIYSQRKRSEGLTPDMRKLALDAIKSAGGLDFAKGVILQLQDAVWRSLDEKETQSGTQNWILRLVLKKLEIS